MCTEKLTVGHLIQPHLKIKSQTIEEIKRIEWKIKKLRTKICTNWSEAKMLKATVLQ